MSAKDVFTIKIDKSASGRRLDVAVSEPKPGLSRNFAATLIKNGNIKIDGKTEKPGHRVKAGDNICVNIPFPAPASFEPEPIRLDILYDDEHIIALNKPAGLVTHPAPGHQSGTLANGLVHQYPEIFDIGEKQRPGIVHRLDKETSGVMVAAKTSFAYERLSEQFRNRKIKKIYMAVVHNEMKSEFGKICLPIGRHPRDRKKMSTVGRNGRDAVTLWKVRESFHGASLLELNLKTGRTHQIRVHCAAIGHPVLGDSTYGGRKKKTANRLLSAQRQMLHAWRIFFEHPRTMEPIFFESPVPSDMDDLLVKLKN